MGERDDKPEGLKANFIVSLLSTPEGELWVGTEDKGLWVRHKDGSWQNYTARDGLGGDNVYALALDRQGRVWAGHGSGGVSVFNGKQWRNYGVLDGPLGERINDIAISPIDGDVWMATNLGLCRYRASEGRWSYLTRVQGLPSDQVAALAFGKDGTLYVGFQSDGIGIAKAPKYDKWQRVGGPVRPDAAPAGSGLPSPFINDMLVTDDGTVYAATTAGLATSRAGGRQWKYVRGADWEEKVRQRLGGPPRGWQAKPTPTLAEDYVTCLALESGNRLWVGHRRAAFDVLDAKSGRMLERGKDKIAVGKALVPAEHYIKAICPVAGSDEVVLATYGDSLRIARSEEAHPAEAAANPNPVATMAFPAPAAPPTAVELQNMLQDVAALPNRRWRRGQAMFLGEDWRTKGDWMGRYGRHYALLCAGDSPLDQLVQTGEGYSANGYLGPHITDGDGLRKWVHNPNWDDPRVLWDPCVGHRRQAEWDDHGEAYDINWEGPDIWVAVEIPEGPHRISLYFFNKDGHDGLNRFRDYTLEMYPWAADYAAVAQRPALAVGRVENFWGGGYENFIACGPSKFLIKIGRNYSHNTILSGIMIDRMAGEHSPDNKVLYDMPMPWMGNLYYDPPKYEVPAGNAGAALIDAVGLWNSMDDAWETQASVSAQRPCRIMAYRVAASRHSSDSMLTNWRWMLRLWTVEDRKVFETCMQDAWEAMKELSPQLTKNAG